MYCYTSSDIVKVCFLSKLSGNIWYNVIFLIIPFELNKTAWFSNRSTTSMTENQQSTLSNGEVSNQKQGHHTLVILVMNDFLALRFVVFYHKHFYHLIEWHLRDSSIFSGEDFLLIMSDANTMPFFLDILVGTCMGNSLKL